MRMLRATSSGPPPPTAGTCACSDGRQMRMPESEDDDWWLHPSCSCTAGCRRRGRAWEAAGSSTGCPRSGTVTGCDASRGKDTVG
ncbi:unnamed protein product [Urochloa humidicola]